MRERADYNFSFSTLAVQDRYSSPRYQLVPISELAEEIQYGTSALAAEEQVGLPVLRMNNLQEDGWDLRDLKYIELSADDAEAYRLHPGDILFNRTNGSRDLVGKCEVFREEGHWVFASYLIRLKIDSAKAIPEYVSAFLNTKAGRLQIERVSRQILMSNINSEEIRSLVIPLPPLSVQRRLAEELGAARQAKADKVNRAREYLAGASGFVLECLRIRVPKQSARTAYAIRLSKCLSSRFDPAYHAPRYERAEAALKSSPFKKMSIGDIAADLAGGATPSRGDDELYNESEGVKFLRIMNVSPFEIVLDDVKYITDDVHNGPLARSQLQTGDVLMTITGRVGTAAVVSHDILPANINQHIVRIRLEGDECLPEYLAAYLNSSLGLTLTNRCVTGGTRGALDYGAVRSLQIPIPPPDIQKQIATEVERRRAEARKLKLDAASEWASAREKFERELLG